MAMPSWTVPSFRRAAYDADWKEEQHKRVKSGKGGGQFTKGGGGGGVSPRAPKTTLTRSKPGQVRQAAGPPPTPGQARENLQAILKPKGAVPPSSGPRQQQSQQQPVPAAPAGRTGPHPGHGYSPRASVVNGVIHTDNVNDAVRALYEGKKVALDQPRQVSTLVSRLGGIAKRMEKLGFKAPNFDLCNVAVAGTNLFCAETKGIPRVKMPQLPDEKAQEFQKYLTDKGFTAQVGQEKAAYLKATQSELVGVKVSGIMGYFRTKDASEDPPLFISKDNYVIDGHHRWAARVGLDAENNKLGQTSLNVIRINLPIIDCLAQAEEFTGGKGHKAATANDRKLWTVPSFRAA
jgi:hypothetical protein